MRKFTEKQFETETSLDKAINMIQTATRLFGLVGYPLSHSFSQKFFSEKFRKEGLADCRYELFPIKNIEDLPTLIERHTHLEGLNVTIPYKEAVIPFLDELEEEAKEIGAVNVIKIRKGKLTGYNTDVFGFEKTLISFLTPHSPIEALILGTGGGAKAVAYVLKRLGIAFRFVSRSKAESGLIYEEVTEDILKSRRLIINTTPLGMYPETGTYPPLPYQFLGPAHYLYDLVYNPEQTVFLKKGKAQGCRTCNGLRMLHLQAERAWEIWNS